MGYLQRDTVGKINPPHVARLVLCHVHVVKGKVFVKAQELIIVTLKFRYGQFL